MKLPKLEKSFSISDRAVYWSEKNDKSPSEVFLQSNKKYWFDCDKCEHNFEKTLGSIKLGRWCPYCSHQKLCDCRACFEKSFGCSGKAVYWSDKNDKCPSEVFKNSATKYWFDCDKCDHDFEKSLAKITSSKRWCPYCSHQKLCDCDVCFDKSFGRSDKAIFWSDKNQKNPSELFLNANTKYWFDCDKCGHDFNVTLNNVSNRKSWCPYCKKKTEAKCLDFLKGIDNIIVKEQFSLPPLSRSKFDFLINDSYILEVDGPQHFMQISNWASHDKTRDRDVKKMRNALRKGYKIIRIQQEVILHDLNNWKKFILDIIRSDNQETIYLNTEINGLYKKHIEDLRYNC